MITLVIDYVKKFSGQAAGWAAALQVVERPDIVIVRTRPVQLGRITSAIASPLNYVLSWCKYAFEKSRSRSAWGAMKMCPVPE